MKVNLHPTRIVVEGYREKDAAKIEKFLSVYEPAIFSYTYEAFRYDAETEVMIFPIGINLDMLLALLKKKTSKLEIVDYRNSENLPTVKNSVIKMKYSDRNEVQKKAVSFLIGAPQSRSGQRLLSLSTGEGKTYCAVKFIALTQRIPLIVLDRKNILTQWIDRIKEYTDTTEDEIFTISGKASVTKLLNMPIKERKKYKFFLAVHRTLSTLIQEDEDWMLELMDKLNISVKIIDEAHAEFKSTTNIDLISDIFTIYLTATPSRSNQHEDLVFQNIYREVPRFSSEWIKSELDIPEKFVNVLLLRTNTKPSEEDKAILETKSSGYGFSVSEYSNFIMRERQDTYSLPLMDIYFDFLIDNGKIKRKTAILVKNINILDYLYDEFEREMKNRNITGYTMSKYHNKVKKKEKDVAFDADIIFTTDSSFGKGVDVAGLVAVISTITTSSLSGTEQMFGRLRYIDGEDLFFIDIIDDGFAKLRTQLTNRKKIYKKKAKSINEIKVNGDDS